MARVTMMKALLMAMVAVTMVVVVVSAAKEEDVASKYELGQAKVVASQEMVWWQ